MRLEKAVELAQKNKQAFRSGPFAPAILIAEKGEFFAKLPSGSKVEYVLKAGEFEMDTWELVPPPEKIQTPIDILDDVLSSVRNSFVAKLGGKASCAEKT